MERLLVGIDGSAPAANVLRWAIGLADAVGAELAVATAVGADAPEGARAQVREEFEVWCAPLREGSHRYRTSILDGDPRVALPHDAVEQGAGLIAVGTSGCGWFPAVHLGHVAHYLALHAEQPVVVVPPGFEPRPPRRLVVGIDGSPRSAEAVTWSAALARAMAGEVVAVYACPPPASIPVSRRVTPDAGGPPEAWLHPLVEAGVPTQFSVVEDQPAKALADAADAEGADAVVVGARGAGGLRGLHLGSVALRLLHHAQVPVAVVPA